jgi:hypothetical protein
MSGITGVNGSEEAPRNHAQRTGMAGAFMRRKWLLALLFLGAVLAAGFSPALFGGRTLLLASWDVPSVMSFGAYDATIRPANRLQRTSDPGASAWQSEAWYKLLSREFWDEWTVPLWNPYNAYGTPLLADAISQPFFPLTTLLSLHVTSWTYDLFIVGRLLLGGMLMFFFARQFLTALPSLFAAITFMLSGYFIIYLNIAHLSVEVLIPGVFLAFELLLRRNSWDAVAGVAAMTLLGMTGGMPESLFLILAFGAVYFVCRLLCAPEFRPQLGALLLKFVISVVLGFALSAFLLLPFLEFLRVAHDVHQTENVGGIRGGLSYDSDYRSTIQYLLPLILGPILNSIFFNFTGWSGLRGYWGVIPFFFAVLALLTLFVREKASNSERFLTIFFAATLVLMVLKRFGNVVINWIGYLPLSEMVLYTKYLEPLMALCVAMLGALGFAALVGRRVTKRQIVKVGLITAGVILLLAASYLPVVRSTPMKTSVFFSVPVKTSLFFYVSVACGVAAVLAIVVLATFARRATEAVRPRLLRAVTVLLALELLINFIVPSFYLLSTLPLAKADPYKGAPYIDFIRANNADYSRVFAREMLLYPNWSSVFGLADVRSLDAMHYRRYRDFIRNFLLPPGAEDRHHGDLADRFTGGDFPYNFDTETEKRFLALSSVKYLISDSEYGWSSKLLDGIIEQHKDENIPGFAADTFRIGDQKIINRRGLFQHPPSFRIPYKTVIDPQEPVLEAIAAIKMEAVRGSDGAGFRLEIKDGAKIETLFETVLDPRNIPADRDGRPVRVDLSRYAGREIELLFSTDPGPRGDVSADWAGWVGLRFTAKDGSVATTSVFKKIYDEEVRIFQVPGILPRAALYGAIEILPDSEVLPRLKDPEFDPNRKVIVSRDSLSSEQVNASQRLAAAAGAPVRAASIVQYQSQRVRIETESAAPSLLMLTDTDFPGWRAYVNGQPAPMVNANYLFRGVFVPAGKSTVEFRYQPGSFQAGVAISFAAFATLAGLMFHERRRRRRRLNFAENTVG